MEHNDDIRTTALMNRFIMRKAIARALVLVSMLFGVSLISVAPSSADSDSQAVAQYKSDKGAYEEALDAYKKAPSSTKAAKAAKAELKDAAVAAQKRAENDRVIALSQAFTTYTDAISRANSNYTAAMAAAGKSAALKNAAKSAKDAAVAAATAAYNAAKNDLKPLPKVT